MRVQLRSPDESRVQVRLDAYCHDCRHRHRLGLTPQGFLGELWEWEAKHRGHNYDVLSPKRTIPARFRDWMLQKTGWMPWWLSYRENANVKISYATSVALTCTLASLASSSAFLAGQEATAVLNTSNFFLDYRVTAKIMTGTTPTVDKEIRLYAYSTLNDTPLYPDVFTGTDGARTLTNAYLLDAALTPLGSTGVSATSNVAYYPRCLTLAQAFGFCPARWGLYVTQNTAVALHATAGNHILSAIGAYITSV